MARQGGGRGAVLVFGVSGQVARALSRCDWSDWSSFKQLSRAEADLARAEAILDAITTERPSLVINAAAYTNVDGAESKPECARRINADAPGLMAKACSKVGAALIQISTDYVFDGTGQRPYREDDPVRPINSYGRSKTIGEQNVREQLEEHVILRTSWVYAPHGRNFVTTMLRLGADRDHLRVVDDQWGCPTSARSIARAIVLLSRAIEQRQKIWGTYHYTDQGPTTWCRLADVVFELAGTLLGRRPRVQPITTEQYPTPAMRPRYSVLDSSKFTQLLKSVPPRWQDELGWTIAQIMNEGRGR